MRVFVFVGVMLGLLVSGVSGEVVPGFNFGWRFANFTDLKTLGTSQKEITEAATDDTKWEVVDLPHDWAISGPFDKPGSKGEFGKLPWQGTGVYRKHFTLPKEAAGKRLIFKFGAVMANPEVYLNGKKVGSWVYGYNSFNVDATEAANFGGENVLAVVAAARSQSSRWYAGAGIYRKVDVVLKDPVHIPIWGVFVTTPKVSKTMAEVNVSIEVVNTSDATASVSVAAVCRSASDQAVATGKASAKTVAPGKTEVFTIVMSVKNPTLWDIESPTLYRVLCDVAVNGKTVDHEEVTTGFRSYQVTANDGFILNGRRVQINGVNLHHDHGPLGAAFFPRAMERQLKMMQEMGVNAIRTSHNMPAPELPAMCDRLGLILYNEAFDRYGTAAGAQKAREYLPYAQTHGEDELRNFVRRDRNSPSVFFWSVGNEVRSSLTYEVTKLLVGFVKKHDPTRNVSQGFCTPGLAKKDLRVLEFLDSSGWNYAQKYTTAREEYPSLPTLYTESASAFGTRGAYKLRLPSGKTDYSKDGECSAFVLTSASWSDIPEVEFERMKNHPYVLGEFVWTGFDYLGEPTPYGDSRVNQKNIGQTGRSSYFGIVDLAGLPKDSFYLYRSHWRPEETTIHLAPHWDWKGHEGKMIPVIGYTNGDEGELFVNGKSYGRKKKGLLRANLAHGKTAIASSVVDPKKNRNQKGLATYALDDDRLTLWRPADGEGPHSWQVDLEVAERFNHLLLFWKDKCEGYKYQVQVSNDGAAWKVLKIMRSDKGAESTLSFPEVKARHLRLVITEGRVQLRQVEVIHKTDNYHFYKARNDYYAVVGKYRLFWDNIPYEPGELKLVVYKDGKQLGEKVVKTSSGPAALKLTADRTSIKADGFDLSYITIEMVDKSGVLCPRAMDDLTFSVEGPIKLMGVANGNQMGLDVFTDNTHPLFYGKAVAVLRSLPGPGGTAKLRVKTTDGKMQAAVDIRSAP